MRGLFELSFPMSEDKQIKWNEREVYFHSDGVNITKYKNKNSLVQSEN